VRGADRSSLADAVEDLEAPRKVVRGGGEASHQGHGRGGGVSDDMARRGGAVGRRAGLKGRRGQGGVPSHSVCIPGPQPSPRTVAETVTVTVPRTVRVTVGQTVPLAVTGTVSVTVARTVT